MARGVDEVAAVVASLAGAAGTALDPTSILARTVAALEPVLPLGPVSLWRERRHGPKLVAATPTRDRTDDPDLQAERGAPGAVQLPLEIRGDGSWSLVVQPPEGRMLDHDDGALLDIAATQVAGALERVELFTEVMELERMKSDFIARVSHELRTPITIINGFLARTSTTTAVPGLGVGLPIARTLVEVLDGRITVADAAPPPGAVVRISLPG